VLNDATLAPKLHELTVSRLLDMVMTNYSISFSRAVSEQDSSSENLWDSVFSSIELTMWSVILSFLVLVVFVVMMIRMERHLRAISLHTTAQH
jgi:ABC-type Fe3+ transport system permease subunit